MKNFKNAQLAKINNFSKPKHYITAYELHEKLNKNLNIKIIGVISPDNSTENIDGAYLVWRNDYSGKNSLEAKSKDLDGFRHTKEQMEELLSKADITSDSEIIIYSSNAHHDASRLFWQIKTLGHKNVKILDGGINKWISENFPLGSSKRLVQENLKSKYISPDYKPKLNYANIEMVTFAIENPNDWVIIDARSEAESNGTAYISGAYGKGGIKNSIHIEWSKTLDSDTLLLDRETLENIYSQTKNKKVIAFCQSGVRSAHTIVVLENVLGLNDVYNYDGSWIEWSYVASNASINVVSKDLRQKVIGYTTNWSEV